MSELVLTSMPSPGVGFVRLNHPPRNVGEPDLFVALERALIECVDAGTRVVVIGSNVPGYFLAHGKLDAIVSFFHDGGDIGDGQAQLRTMRLLDRGDMVSVAAVDGQAWGGGAELMWACDLRVVSRQASIGQPEVNVGVTPGWGGAVKIARLAGEATALRLLLDGRPIDGEEAFRLGLAQRLATQRSAEAEALEWAAWLADRPPWALRANKALVKSQRDLPLKDALQLERSTFAQNARRPETAELMQRASERYRNGASSHAVFGVHQDDEPHGADAHEGSGGTATVACEGEVIIATVRGEPTAALLRQCHARILELTQNVGQGKVLYDARDMLAPQVDVPWSQRELDESLGPIHLRRAIVVPDARIAFLARLAFGGGDYRVFYDDRDAALRWLTGA